MKKIIYSLLLILLCGTKLTAQVCTLVDSFNINLPGVDTAQMQQTKAIAYSGGYLWISANSDSNIDYFAELANIYKYDLSMNRVDSIPYYLGSGQAEITSLAGDGTYLWAYMSQIDTVYQINIATKTFVGAYSMGGRGTDDISYAMASIGDTLYFIGQNAGKSFKFSKSTGAFVDYANYVGNTGVYPSGMCGVGTSLVSTTYLVLPPVSFNDASTIDPGSFTENVSAREPWCVDIGCGITYGSDYFWQIKTAFVFFDIRNCYVYKVQSSLSSLGVHNVANEQDFVISPNPVNETINITCPEASGWDSFTVDLFSITGTKILSKNVSNSNGNVSIDISRLDLSAGMYFIKLSNGAQQIMKNVCVQ